jgi:hypothetical protein
MPAKLQPPIGLPTAESAADEEAWSQIVSGQLDNARKTAENWRNGLLGLTGLIAGFSLVKGPSDIGALEKWAACAAGGALMAAMACAVWGAWKSLHAAYGTNKVVQWDEFNESGGANGMRLRLATTSAEKLRCSKALTIAALVFYAVAIGLTWYGPRAEAGSLNVERRALPNVCGRLVASKEGQLDLLPPGRATVRVNLADVVRISTVDRCP